MESGRLKITEQGEVIAYRYLNVEIARRHLHQTLHAVLVAVGAPSNRHVKAAWRALLHRLAQDSKQTFQDLVYRTEGFLRYWQEATPIHELGLLPISSRPPKRTAGGSFDDVRAIPWVFSWMQSRAIIPSWYGVGSALDAALCAGDLPLLRQMYRDWPFFCTLLDNLQLDLAKADMGIAEHYASLVSERVLGAAIFGRIRDEHSRAVACVCQILEVDDILADSPVIKRSIERRNPYVDPLNFVQVTGLRRLRSMEKSHPDYEATLNVVLNTINAIAAGMKTTG
jgi:phosphoenolpyruvate carboxylase